jgi:Spy/CpxP family protein refolding chaperone
MKNLAAILLIAVMFIASTASRVATANVAPGNQPAQEPVADFFNGRFPPYAERFVELMTERLNLTDAQKAEIRAILAAERPTVEPLVHQLITAQEELRAAIRARGFNETETRAFVARYTGTVTELIVAKERIAARIYAVLTPEQRARLDELRAGAAASQTGGAVSGSFPGTGNLSSFMSGDFSRIMSGLNLTSLQQLRLLMIVSSESSVIDPLLQRLSETAGQLRTATVNGQFNEAQVRALAAQQAETLAALGVAVLRFVSKTYEVLTPEQRAQIEALRDTLEMRLRGLFSFFSIDDQRYFVRQQYVDFLNREPEPDGFAYWTGLLRGCGTDANCLNGVRVEISSRFFAELEFQRTGYYVMRLWKSSYGQFPNYQQFITDRRQVQNNETSQRAFAVQFVGRAEFQARYPVSLSASEFVTQLYNAAGANTFTQERQAHIAAINTGQKTRADVLHEVANLPVFSERTPLYNQAWVRMQYFGYLRRDAEAQGEAYWTDVINNQLRNNYQAMICAFLNSAEYHGRFGTQRGQFTETSCSRFY